MQVWLDQNKLKLNYEKSFEMELDVYNIDSIASYSNICKDPLYTESVCGGILLRPSVKKKHF